MKQGLESNGFSFPLHVTQSRERSCPITEMDKDLRQGTEEELVTQPELVTKRTNYKALPAGHGGLFKGGSQQYRGGSAFPSDLFCSRPPAGQARGERRPAALSAAQIGRAHV